MKIWIFALTLILLTSVNVMAEKCFVKAGISYPDPGYKSPSRLSTYSLEYVYYENLNSPNECYKQAIINCSKFPDRFEINLPAQSSRILGGKVTVSGAVYCEWTYDDSYLHDTSGYVTKYSDSNKYITGNAVVLGKDQLPPQ